MQVALKKYIRLTDYLNKFIGWVLFIILAIMSVLISWQVFSRFVVGSSLTFSEEASRFLMIWLTMLGAAYAIRDGSLIAIDFLENKFKGSVSGKVLKVIMSCLASVFYIILIVQGYEMAQSVAFQTAPTTGVSMFWPMLAIPVGGFFMLLNTIAVLFEEFIDRKETAQ